MVGRPCLEILVALTLAGALPDDGAAQARPAPERFAGEVVRGQVFERDIGAGLVFRLVPYAYGWTVVVGARTRPDADFLAVVTSASDHDRARVALETLLWPSDDTGREEARRALEAIEARAGRGRLRILDFTLGNLDVGRQAWIERMRFEAELVWP